jgi:hypothetical protein
LTTFWEKGLDGTNLPRGVVNKEVLGMRRAFLALVLATAALAVTAGTVLADFGGSGP